MAIVTPTATPTSQRTPSLTPDDITQPPAGGAGLAPDSEARLRTAAAAGDRTAFAALYASYHEPVYRFLLRRARGDRHLAEDLTQDTFARALSGVGRYRETGRPFGAWLMTIASNLLTDYWRSGWHRRHHLWDDFTGETEGRLTAAADSDGDPAVDVTTRDQRRQLAETLARAVSRLSDRQQQVVSLRFARGLSVADTADLLGLEIGAVKAATYRARQALSCDPSVERLR
ncbi:MAG TPA: sigma-70 family RNA polymerase sigma factor [Natronosporangium sp.]